MDPLDLISFFSITSAVCFFIYKITMKFEFFYDKNVKKFHTTKALNIGGLIILINILISIYFFQYPKVVNSFLVFTFPLFFLGFLDDIKEMSPTTRIFVQFFIIYFIINENQLDIKNLGSYEFIGIIELGIFSKIFTSLCVIMIINASNYNDGIDGWSNINFLISNMFLIIIFIFFDNLDFIYIPIILMISSLVVLIFNFGILNKVKIFLGNGGSLILGYLLAMEILYFEKNNTGIHSIIFASILSYYVFEFLAVNINRMYKKKNIFVGGKDHFHYALYYYFSKKTHLSLIILILNQIIITGIILFTFYLFGAIYSLIIYLALFFVFLKFRIFFLLKNNFQ